MKFEGCRAESFGETALEVWMATQEIHGEASKSRGKTDGRQAVVALDSWSLATYEFTVVYDGEPIYFCPPASYFVGHVAAVAVSGDSWNPCGHLLLYTSSGGGMYFHVTGVNSAPKHMSEEGDRRYLRENRKHELSRTTVTIPNPNAAHSKLEELISKRWLWGVLPHNCASFVEVIIAAGGSAAGLYSNCPAIETFR